MVNVAWATPDAIGRLTPMQLLCLCREHAPGEGRHRTFEEFQAASERDG